MDNLFKPLIACSAEHAVAVGVYGHLFVWGKNTYCESPSNTLNEETGPSHENPKKISGKLGFTSSDLCEIPEPTYIPLTHPLYKVNVTQVACGLNFTAVVAQEKPNILEEPNTDDLLFMVETDERAMDYNSMHFKQVSPEDLKNAILANQIRSDLCKFLSSKNLDFMGYFKSRKIKEITFLSLMIKEVGLSQTEEEIKRFIKYKKMRLPGNDLILNPLYELVMKSRQGQGLLYLIGSKEICPREFQDILSIKEIKDQSLAYNLVYLPPMVIVSKVCCGSHFVMILGNNGIAYNWGEKNLPVLGKNRVNSYNQVRVISGLVSESVKIIDIACGYSHCMALNDNGVVLTWGEGDFGKLGNSRMDSLLRPEPINIESKDPLLIKAYGHSSFSLMKDGTCYVWGSNAYKKFGKDYYRTYYVKATQLITNSKHSIIDIAIGENTVIYLEKNGFLYQITGSGELSLSKKNKNLEGVEFYQVSCNENTFFALSVKGNLVSWSTSQSDIVGRLSDHLVPTEIVTCSQQFPIKEAEEEDKNQEKKATKSTKIISCSCADENTFLITDKGEVLISGSNEFSQAGIAQGDIEGFQVPDVFEEFIMVPRLSSLFKMKVDCLATGYSHVFALCNGKIFSWGANASGQLGHGFFSMSERLPELVKAFETYVVVKAAAGLNHSLVLTNKGQVFAFGNAESGKLGLGRMANAISVCDPRLIPNLKEIEHISCNVGHSLAISKSSKMLVWGDNWNGQLGIGNKDNYFEPTELLGFLEWKTGVCGVNHTVALSLKNKVFHWGQVNLKGEEPDLLFPTPVKGLEEITIREIFASDGHSAALLPNESGLYTWGKQIHSRLAGNKGDIQDHEISKLNIFSIPGEKIHNVSISSMHGCIVTDQNFVYTWGYFANGRLGDLSFKMKDKHFTTGPVEMKKYLGMVDNDSEVVEEVITDLQFLLQNEPDELSESNIKEVDQQIAQKFVECIDEFIKITGNDEHLNKFMENVQYKMLMRLQQKPIGCVLIENTDEELKGIDEKLPWYGSMITTYHIHPCYVFKLLFEVKIKPEQRAEMISFLYADMEGNEKLIYTCIYLSQMILKKALEEDLTLETVFSKTNGDLYRQLVIKMIMASSQDMGIMRVLAEEILLNLHTLVNQDEVGIDIDPFTASKLANNKLSAYQNSRTTMDRRMNKLKQLLVIFSRSFIRLKPSAEIENTQVKPFSPLISIIIRDFLSKCSKRFSLKIAKFDYQLEQIKTITHLVLGMIFAPLCKMVSNPQDFYLVVENKQACSTKNLASICEALQSFLSGQKIGETGDRWLAEINTYNCTDAVNLQRKVEILEFLYNRKFELEELYLNSMFKESLSQFDRVISMHGRTLIKLHSLSEKNLEILRVNNPSYDPLIYICKELGLAPSIKVLNSNECVNLTLYTRSLRQDQSIVRCPKCKMLIPRDMAPSNYKQVIEIYDPMPPNSPVYVFSKILSNGCKKLSKLPYEVYLNEYEARCEKYLKDYIGVDSVMYLINLIDTKIAADNEIPIDTSDENQLRFIEKLRERELKKVEKQCEIEYLRRKHHRKHQDRLTRIFNKLLELLTEYKEEVFFNDDRKKNLMFNVEYGGSNRELEKFSDSVMFSLFLNKIRDYTMNKDMSINLYESLKGDVNDSLKGFMKRSLGELIRKKCFIGQVVVPPHISQKNIAFAFEVDKGNFNIIISNSPKKINLFGRDEFRQEELLIYSRITSDEISEMREKVKKNPEETSKILTDSESSFVFPFSSFKLLDILGTIEDRIAAYHQNICIAKVEENTEERKKDKSEIDIDKTFS